MAKITYPKIDLTDVKTIFIDIDDTLYQYEPCHKYALNYCADTALNDYNFKISADEFKDIYREYRSKVTDRLYPQGVCRSRLVAFMEMFAYMKLDNSYNLALIFDKLYWDKLISYIKLEDDAKKLLEEAYKRNITVAAVTDMTTSEQIRKINQMNIEKYIKYIISSETAGAEKPSKIIFEYALQMTNANTSSTIMIGDSEKKDGEGAKQMGIKFYKVTLNDE